MFLRAPVRSEKFTNFGVWCDGSITTHFVLDKFDAIKHCDNLNSSVCKFFVLKRGTWAKISKIKKLSLAHPRHAIQKKILDFVATRQNLVMPH